MLARDLDLAALVLDLAKELGILDGEGELLGDRIDEIQIPFRVGPGRQAIEEENADRFFPARRGSIRVARIPS